MRSRIVLGSADANPGFTCTTASSSAQKAARSTFTYSPREIETADDHRLHR